MIHLKCSLFFGLLIHSSNFCKRAFHRVLEAIYYNKSSINYSIFIFPFLLKIWKDVEQNNNKRRWIKMKIRAIWEMRIYNSWGYSWHVITICSFDCNVNNNNKKTLNSISNLECVTQLLNSSLFRWGRFIKKYVERKKRIFIFDIAKWIW